MNVIVDDGAAGFRAAVAEPPPANIPATPSAAGRYDAAFFLPPALPDAPPIADAAAAAADEVAADDAANMAWRIGDSS